jgi:hypothetical protein
VLGVGATEAKQIIASLELQGYVKPYKKEYVTTFAGEGVSGAKSPRFTTAKIDAAIEALRSRIKSVNRDPRSAFRIDKAVAFGDFLAKGARGQAADIGIRLSPNSRAKEKLSHRNFLKRLRNRSAMLNLVPYEEWMESRSHRALS